MPQMSPRGYKRRFGPRRWYDRSTPESRPSSGNVRLSWRGGPLYRGQPTALGEVCQDRL